MVNCQLNDLYKSFHIFISAIIMLNMFSYLFFLHLLSHDWCKAFREKTKFLRLYKKNQNLTSRHGNLYFFLHPLLNCLAIVNEFLADT